MFCAYLSPVLEVTDKSCVELQEEGHLLTVSSNQMLLPPHNLVMRITLAQDSCYDTAMISTESMDNMMQNQKALSKSKSRGCC